MRLCLLSLAVFACRNKITAEDLPLEMAKPPETAAETGLDPAKPCDGTLEYDVCWVTMQGGRYKMGAQPEVGSASAVPRHRVRLRDFAIMRTEATITLHERCVAEGACQPIAPDPPSNCVDQGPDDPRGCLDWYKATELCQWLSARLPSESEWEFAARSRGQERLFPWGDAPPDCSLAVLGYAESDTCGESGPAAVCSRPAGNTEQGLCDIAGNLFEWVEDWYHDTYDGAPADGSPWNVPRSTLKTLRGGGINSDEPVSTWSRTFHVPEFSYSGMGVRCVRDL